MANHTTTYKDCSEHTLCTAVPGGEGLLGGVTTLAVVEFSKALGLRIEALDYERPEKVTAILASDNDTQWPSVGMLCHPKMREPTSGQRVSYIVSPMVLWGHGRIIKKKGESVRVKQRWQKVKRLAHRVGTLALFVKRIYEEIHFRPGGRGAKRCREDFERRLALVVP